MPRGFKCRRVCSVPDNRIFIPQKPCGGTVTLTVEELETVRLCDLEGLDQEAASLSMNVSRATLQRILYQARKKVAEALCAGKTIEIVGGNYELAERPCGCRQKCANCRFENKAEIKE
jgi:Predicted DNA-binding proteins